MASPFNGARTSSAPYSTDLFIAGLLSEDFIRWGDGSDTILSYSFPWTTSGTAIWGTDYGSNEPDADYYFGLNSAQMTAVENALSAWSSIIDVDFVKIYETDTSVGDLRFAFTSGIDEGFRGWAYYPDNYWPSGGDVWINADLADEPNWSKSGDNIFISLLHEIGHALGLEHPFDGSDGDTYPLDYDTKSFTVMSYTSPDDAWVWDSSTEQYSWTIQTPMVYDILAAQYLYGANWDYNSENTIYMFDPNEAVRKTIWDGGGQDTFDFSGFALNLFVDLAPGSYSDAPTVGWDASQNIGIAFGAIIENIIGGSGDDYLSGNSVDNRITGGAGNDLLDGGDGLDTAIFNIDRNYYTLTLSPSATTITDRNSGFNDGTDHLTDIEFLVFDSDFGTPFDLTQFNSATQLSEAQFTELAEMYVAYFNRAPDAEGLLYWADKLAEGRSMDQIAERFFNQDETRALYTDPSNTDAFVTAVYANVLGRTPDADGFTFWTGKLDAGEVTQGAFVLKIILGAKNGGGANDVAYLSDKADVGLYFSAIKGMSDSADGRQVMATFGDQSTSNKSDAKTAVDGHYADATASGDGEFIFKVVGIVSDPFADFV
jgi:serralysin